MLDVHRCIDKLCLSWRLACAASSSAGTGLMAAPGLDKFGTDGGRGAE